MGNISLRGLALSKNERPLMKLLQTLEFEACMNEAIDRGGDLAVDPGLGHCGPAKASRPLKSNLQRDYQVNGRRDIIWCSPVLAESAIR